MDYKKFMQLAIDKAMEGKIPFAACIIKNNKVLACEYSGVFRHAQGMSGAFR
ncbi:MAG: hypothetical protein LVQ95_04085 [Candidatus Micrarchaeales archaeon]|nr:hypothetical protein [Candidatus Micrarchaeales archaeon]